MIETTTDFADANRALLQQLHRWSDSGWLRPLDSTLAAFVATLSPSATPAVLLATALLAHLEGQGHSCLSILQLVGTRGAFLEWDDDATAALADAMRQLPATVAGWRDALRACDAVQSDVAAPDRREPLVLRGDRLYLRRYWQYERKVAAHILARLGTTDEVDTAAQVGQWLQRLFPSSGPPDDAARVDWQKVACALAARGRFAVITGGPGTGKTYTAARLLALLFAIDPAPERLRVALAAPTGKAAARLRQAIDSALTRLQPQTDDVPALRGLASRIAPARTLHSLLGARPDTRRFRHDATHPVAIDVLIVDEASMVHLEMMASLLDALPPHCRVVLLGDKDQLASVEAGSVLGDLCRGADAAGYDSATRRHLADVLGEALPGSASQAGPLAQQTVVLRESRRFAGAIGALALAVNAGDAAEAASLLRAGENELSWLGDGTMSPSTALRDAVRLAAGGVGYRRYCELLRARPAGDDVGHAAWVGDVLCAFDQFRILCAAREGDAGVTGMNRAVEAALVGGGLLNRAAGDWYEGRPVIVTRNDPAVGVFNGDVGIALRAPAGAGEAGALRVYFEGGAAVRSTLSSRLGQVETAYAMTVHKSQGSEFDHVLLSLPKGHRRSISRELVYTGLTRARTAFTLLTEGPDALAAALARRVARGSGLAELMERSPILPSA